MIRDITINDIKIFYQYKYRFIDVKNGKDVKGYIYGITNSSSPTIRPEDRFWHCYFIDDNETYFKFIKDKSDN
tara:strand:- start:685 stop:903 length:219 start_codon:yes stop_codon:yes gene_type:complete